MVPGWKPHCHGLQMTIRNYGCCNPTEPTGKKIYETDNLLYRPTWSNDGSYLYFLDAEESSTVKVDLRRVAFSSNKKGSVENAAVVHAFSGNTYYFTFSEDNTRIVYDSQPLVTILFATIPG